MKIRKVMTAPVVTCDVNDSIQRCAQLMRDHNVGFMPVVNGTGDVVGVVTDRDLAIRALAEARPATTPVQAFLSGDVVACRADDELWFAEETLARSQKIRLVVTEDGMAVGVVSLADLGQVEDHDRFGRLYQVVTQRETSRPLAKSALASPVTWII